MIILGDPLEKTFDDDLWAPQAQAYSHRNMSVPHTHTVKRKDFRIGETVQWIEH